MKHLVFVIVMVVVSSTLAFAATDFQKFDKKVRKFAVESNLENASKPKGLCLCQDASSFPKITGVLMRTKGSDFMSATVHVDCVVLFFDQVTGDLDASGVCDIWVPLAK